MKQKIPLQLLIVVIATLFTSCEKPKRNNPYDEKANASDWGLKNLKIEDVSITEKKLTWTYYGDDRFEGFKLDRKKGDEPWLVAYQTFHKNKQSWNDKEIIPDASLIYSYRVYAYAGSNFSNSYDTTFSGIMPAPVDLIVSTNSNTSVTLTWEYHLSGIDGFKIDRKVNDGTWVVGFATINSGTTYSNDGLDLNNNTYYYRIYAYYNQYESLKGDSKISLKCGDPFIDVRDGMEYQSVQIGDQCWMKENLKYLPSVSDPNNGSQTSPYYYVYGYEGTNIAEAKATNNYQTFGVLYNWPAASMACPQGWSLPTDDEWTILTDFLGGTSVAGGKMKETGTAHWNSPNTGATNSSGFSGLPGGNRYGSGSVSFNHLGLYGRWWISTDYSSTSAWLRILGSNYGNVYSGAYSMEFGFSVRCLRD